MYISFNFYFFILHSWLCVTNFFPIFVEASIVAWYSVSIVSHVKKNIVSLINLRKMILKFHYAIAK